MVDFKAALEAQRKIKRVIIAGRRFYTPSEGEISDGMRLWHPRVILSGGCSGADQAGEKWALSRGISVAGFPADWDTWGKAAGPMRNSAMAQQADALLAFWDGKKKGGTWDMIKQARKRGLEVRIADICQSGVISPGAEKKPQGAAPLGRCSRSRTMAKKQTGLGDALGGGGKTSYFNQKSDFEGKKVLLRILPSPSNVKNPKEKEFWGIRTQHWIGTILGPGKAQAVTCPKTFKMTNPCPICERYNQVIASGVDRQKLRCGPSRQAVMNAIFIDAQTKKLVGSPKLFTLGFTGAKELGAITDGHDLDDDETGGPMWNKDLGTKGVNYDLRVTKGERGHWDFKPTKKFSSIKTPKDVLDALQDVDNPFVNKEEELELIADKLFAEYDDVSISKRKKKRREEEDDEDDEDLEVEDSDEDEDEDDDEADDDDEDEDDDEDSEDDDDSDDEDDDDAAEDDDSDDDEDDDDESDDDSDDDDDDDDIEIDADDLDDDDDDDATDDDDDDEDDAKAKKPKKGGKKAEKKKPKAAEKAKGKDKGKKDKKPAKSKPDKKAVSDMLKSGKQRKSA